MKATPDSPDFKGVRPNRPCGLPFQQQPRPKLLMGFTLPQAAIPASLRNYVFGIGRMTERAAPALARHDRSIPLLCRVEQPGQLRSAPILTDRSQLRPKLCVGHSPMLPLARSTLAITSPLETGAGEGNRTPWALPGLQTALLLIRTATQADCPRKRASELTQEPQISSARSP